MLDRSHGVAARWVLCGLIAVACIQRGGYAFSQSQASGSHVPTIPAQIAQDEQKLVAARAANDPVGVATELNTLASLYRQTGEREKALDYCNQALQIERGAGNRLAEALTENLLGRIYTDLGDEQKALDLFNQILPVWREFGSRLGEGLTLSNMGRVYNNLGQREDALKVLNQALPDIARG